MESHERARIEELVDRDEELRRLWTEHQDLHERIAQLDAIPYLTPVEELERKQLQKRKLMGRDRMQRILARYAD